MEQTIVALGTPPAASALAVIRLSGPRAITIADAVFRPVSGRPLSSLAGYRAAYGAFTAGKEALDEGIVLILRAPKSYTGEDMAELSCHGNQGIAARIIAACIAPLKTASSTWRRPRRWPSSSGPRAPPRLRPRSGGGTAP